ncbi:MAG: hypothetical protein J5494_04715 [Candidatus Methanomethylophilaceae archaeon]|nr:hypothetical protein [Candidatus Methanomethylophilaceae archaeon]
MLLDNVSKMKEIFEEDEYRKVASGEIDIIREIATRISEARSLVIRMEETADRIIEMESERERAVAFHDEIVPFLDEIRVHVDALEMIVDDQMWPLPKYRELLFVR